MESFQIGKKSENGYVTMFEGIDRKTLAYGEKTLITEFRLAEGKILPSHNHPQEQTGYLISGHMILIIDGERNEVLPGDSWNIKGNIEHSAEILKDSIAIEVFSPVREDFI